MVLIDMEKPQSCDECRFCEYEQGYCTALPVGEWRRITDMSECPLIEQKTGKWVLAHPLQEDDGGAYVCSCCKSGSYEVIPKTWKACPWCTALMEVDE